ncbi:MAG TPA: DJ-1/PfpI family protein [Ktedonobacteraceae bacterium]|jgi:putative intracellular protease/amidase
MTRNVAILVFDDVEVLDCCGPFEVFGVAGLRGAGERPFSVYTVAEKMEPVIARNGLSINPGFTIADCPQADILLVPGGQGTRREIHNEALYVLQRLLGEEQANETARHMQYDYWPQAR